MWRRLLSIAFLLGCAAVVPVYAHNFLWFFSESQRGVLVVGQWHVVAIYAVMYSLFALFLVKHPLKLGEWKKEGSMYVAFIVALFAEMFGLPLTLFFLSALAPLPAAAPPTVAVSFTFLGNGYSMLVSDVTAGVVSALAFALVFFGWRDVFRSKKLVTTGVYDIVRHPQYLGILSVATVWALAWPTLITLLMWPVLVYAYYRLSRSEEKEMRRLYGRQYDEYAKRVPMLLPVKF
jgi:protein-S-isoprenylcysteine O-methyltransferase Ste14